MKHIAVGVILTLLAATGAQAQAYSTQGGTVCLRSSWIDHTKAPDDRTILFYMRDHKVWVTHLRSLCPQLSFNGFAYVATPPDDICGNLQSIRVIRSGAVCMMGPIVPYTPPPHGGT